MNKEKLREIYGFDLNKESKLALLKEVRESGKPIEQVISEGKILPILPQSFILDGDGKIEYRGKRITVAEYERINPLKSYAKIILIGTRERMNKYHNQK